MPNYARFTIEATPSTAGGYDASNGQTLHLQLEGSVAAVVQRTTFEVHSADLDSPLQSGGAPTLTLVGATSGQKVDSATPGGAVTCVLPSSGAHSYVVRCLVNGGLNGYGRVDPDYVFERLVAIRAATGERKVVRNEETAYSQGGIEDAINELVDTVASINTSGSAVAGYKTPCRVASDAALPAYNVVANVYTATANGALPLINGLAMSVGDRILLASESGGQAPFNGIVVVTSLGSGGTPWVLTRAADANTSALLPSGVIVPVNEGTNRDLWQLVTAPAINLNTTPLTFSSVSTTKVTVGANLTDADQTLSELTGCSQTLLAGTLSAPRVKTVAAVGTPRQQFSKAIRHFGQASATTYRSGSPDLVIAANKKVLLIFKWTADNFYLAETWDMA